VVLTHAAGTHGLQDGTHAVGHGRAGGTEQGKKHFPTLPVNRVRPNPQASGISTGCGRSHRRVLSSVFTTRGPD